MKESLVDGRRYEVVPEHDPGRRAETTATQKPLQNPQQAARHCRMLHGDWASLTGARPELLSTCVEDRTVSLDGM